MAKRPTLRIVTGKIGTIADEDTQQLVLEFLAQRIGFTLPNLPTAIGDVYFVSGAGLVKVGYTGDVVTRLRELQVGSPIKLQLEARVVGTRLHEHVFHRLFSGFHSHGEWFHRTDQLDRAIRQAQAKVPIERMLMDHWEILKQTRLREWKEPYPGFDKSIGLAVPPKPDADPPPDFPPMPPARAARA